jgi:hypothetical protein
MIKHIRILLACLVIAGCGGGKDSKKMQPPAAGLTNLSIQASLNPEAKAYFVEDTLTLKASAKNAEGKDVPVTPEWSVEPNDSATISAEGQLRTTKAGDYKVVAIYKDLRAEKSIQSVKPQLESIDINVPLSVVAFRVGETIHLTAKGTLSNTKEIAITPIWSVNPDEATIDANGMLVSKKAGRIAVKAEFEGKETTVDIVVEAVVPVLEALDIVVPVPVNPYKVGEAIPVIAMGRFNDGTEREVPAEWNVDLAKGTYAAGHVTAKVAGPLTIEAKYSGLTFKKDINIVAAALIKLEVGLTVASPSTRVGDEITFKADGKLSDGTEVLSYKVQWTVTGPDGIITADGKFKASKPGSYTVTATHGTISSSFKFTISTAEITSVKITLPTNPMRAGDRIHLTASGIMNNGETVLNPLGTWTVDRNQDATITPEGILIAKKSGRFIVTFTSSGIPATVEVNVKEAELIALTVSLKNASTRLRVGDEIGFNAEGTLSDNTVIASYKVDWSVSGPDAQISVDGKFKASKSGDYTVVAESNGIKNSMNFTVQPLPTLVSIEIGIPSPNFNPQVGVDIPLFLTATYSDLSKVPVKGATWSVTNSGASVSSEGVFKATVAGTYTVKANLQGRDATKEIVIAPAKIEELKISLPQGVSTITVGDALQLEASARYSDGTVNKVNAAWTLADTATTLATLSASGEFKALGGGIVEVIATFQGMPARISLTLEKIKATQLKVVLDKDTLLVGDTANLSAYLIDATGREINADQVSWALQGPSQVVQLDSTGRLIALAAGSATITARYSGPLAQDISAAPLTVIVSGTVLPQVLKIVDPGIQTVGTPFQLKAQLVSETGAQDVIVEWSIADADGILKLDRRQRFVAAQPGKAKVLATYGEYKAQFEVEIAYPQIAIKEIQFWVHQSTQGTLTFNTPWDEVEGDGIKRDREGIADYATACADNAKAQIESILKTQIAQDAFGPLTVKGVPPVLTILVNVVDNDRPSTFVQLRKLDRDAYFWHWHWVNKWFNTTTREIEEVVAKPSLALTRFDQGEWIYEVIASPENCRQPKEADIYRYAAYAKTRKPFKKQEIY